MQAHRAPDVAAFLEALSACLIHASASQPANEAFVERLFTKLDESPCPCGSPRHRDVEVREHLGAALGGLRDASPALRHLGRAFAEVEPLANWSRRSSSGPDAARFAARHGNVMIVGPGGIEERDDLLVGISLMAPGTEYPHHTHPPDELYLVLSEGEWVQGGGAWFTPGIGGIVRNPPGVVHSMRSGPKPLLAAWGLLA